MIDIVVRNTFWKIMLLYTLYMVYRFFFIESEWVYLINVSIFASLTYFGYMTRK
jgi:hypothetical protein